MKQRIVAFSPALAGRPEFATISNLGTVDVLATRLWLDRRVPLKNPSNVLAGFEPTTGATVFDLNALQVRIFWSLLNFNYQNWISNYGNARIHVPSLLFKRHESNQQPTCRLYHVQPRDESTQTTFACFIMQNEFADQPGSVFEVDFYHANQLLPLTDDAVIKKVRMSQRSHPNWISILRLIPYYLTKQNRLPVRNFLSDGG